MMSTFRASTSHMVRRVCKVIEGLGSATSRGWRRMAGLRSLTGDYPKMDKGDGSEKGF